MTTSTLTPPESTPSIPVASAPASDMTSPYRGLTPYSEADAAYFFGRTAEIATITANLEVTRLTIFYGPSGVGKSSVLRAGVVHGLNQRAKANFAASGVAEQIAVYCQRWSSDPLLALSQAVSEAVAPFVAPNTPPASGSLLNQLLHWSTQSQSELLLILDQFEEFFLYHSQPQTNSWDASSFAAQLTQVINHSSLPVNVLISLREDALARLDYFEGRIPALLDNRLSIGHLSYAAGREAVTQPLHQFNRDQQTDYQIEESLVTAVLSQVGSGQVALSRQGAGGRANEGTTTDGRIEAPYLQLVLTRIWEQEQRNHSTHLRLTTLDEELGGAERIVRNYLDATLDSLSDEERGLSARLLDRLVTPSGSKIALSLEDLARYAGDERARLPKLLEQLQDRRLLHGVQTPGGVTQYEIFHDVLGPALLDWQERYQKAQAEENRLDEEKRARTTAEAQAAAAEHLAQTQTKSAKQLRRLVYGLVSLILIATAITTFALWQTRLVTGFSLALEARAFVDKQELRLATLLALEAQKLNPSQGDHVLSAEIPREMRYIRSKPLLGHKLLINDMAWQPNGKKLATASWDRTIILWDVTSGKSLTTLNGHISSVNSVAWSPDSKLLASASGDSFTDDNSVILWEIDSGNQLMSLHGHTTDVISVAWRPDGKMLASGSMDNSIILWDTASGEKVSTLQGHSAPVGSVTWHPDGILLASASWDNTIIIWNVESGEFSTIKSRGGNVSWKPDGKQLAFNTDDNEVAIWDMEEYQIEMTLKGHRDTIRQISWRPDGKQIASAANDNSVIIWDTVSGEQVMTLHHNNGSVSSVAWQPDGKQLASASAKLNLTDPTVTLWDLTTVEKVTVLQNDGYTSANLVWQPDGQKLASESLDRTMLIWDMTNDERVALLQGNNGNVRDKVWRPDGKQWASFPTNRTMTLWDSSSNKQVATLSGHTTTINKVTWRSDGKQVAADAEDNTIIVWDAENGKLLAKVQGHSASVTSVGWRPDGRWLASASDDKSVMIWDISNNEWVATLIGHTAPVSSVAWRPDGKQLASASAGLSGSDNSIILWDVEDKTQITNILGHDSGITSIAWRPDGKQLASASWDSTIKLWDTANGNRLITTLDHSDGVRSIVWRPDGKQLAVASGDDLIVIYPQVYLEPPCKWAWSNLTPDEWVRYRGWAIYRPTCPQYPISELPSIFESLNNRSEYLFISWPGRLFFCGILLLSLLVIALPIWGIVWLVRRLRRRRQRRLVMVG